MTLDDRPATTPSGELIPALRGWLHGAAVPVAAVVAVLLWRAGAPGPARVSTAVFGIALVGLYSVSALYHLVRWSARGRRWLGRMDGAMIQLFIAATFTPVAVHALGGMWRTTSLVIAGTIALIGAGVAMSPTTPPARLSVAAYVTFGLLAAIPLVRIGAVLDPAGTALIAAGGAIYILGGLVYARRSPDPWPAWFGFHEVFHVLVVLASATHVIAIWRYVLPLAAPGASGS
ncbi:MAG: hemolysin III family protein [Nitriliruptoraceae bacterium]